MSRLIQSLPCMWRWARKTKRCAGSSARSRSIPGHFIAICSVPSFARFAPTRVSRISCVESESISLKYQTGKRIREPEDLLRRIEAAQCFQGVARYGRGRKSEAAIRNRARVVHRHRRLLEVDDQRAERADS